jgi:hypothetical protein
MSARFWLVRTLALLACAAVLGAAGTASAQCFGFRGNNVGGISVDAKGVVAEPNMDGNRALLQILKKDVRKPAADLSRPAELRVVSLKGLEAAVADAVKNNHGVLPDEVRYLAGLQRIEYVFVYPEEGDIILAGPGEGWKVRDDAVIVGVTTDRPVMQLDDLVVALRTAGGARETPISCSIDPTPEGQKNLDALLAEFSRKRTTFSPEATKLIEKALGPQQITVTGLPPESHMARVLVAADFRMKRIAMHLDPSPLPKELPSFLTMLQQKKAATKNMMPRWWLACNYEPLGKSPDGLAWELRGPGVQCMTEDDFVAADGKRQGSGKKNDVAVNWANAMTEHYDALSQKDSIFGELRNVMDMCVIGALIEKEGLLSKAKLDLPTLLGSDSELKLEKWNSPKTVATQSSFMKSGREYIITASGGVDVTSWQVASQAKESAEVKATKDGVKVPTKAWWSN